MASGDAKADREVEDEILARLDRGEIEAWCIAIVTAEIEIDGVTFKGRATMGGCSYETEAQLRQSCFEEYGMKEEALADLKATLIQEAKRAAIAAKALKEIGS